MGDEAKTPYLGTGGNHRHTLVMIIGCLLPLVFLGILWFAGAPQNILYFGILLLCPIMHFVLMRNMDHGATGHSTRNAAGKAEESKRERLT